MKRIVMALLLGFSLTLWPLTASAGETRVYVSVSIGGAVVIGGGLLLWNFSYSSQVSQNEPDPPVPPSLIRSLVELKEHGPAAVTDRFIERETEPLDPLWVELPLWVFRW